MVVRSPSSVPRMGIAELDAQHECIDELLERLALTQGQRRDSFWISCILGEVRSHFLCEEMWMRREGYPEAHLHAQDHASLLREGLILQERIQQGSLELQGWALDFLREWFRSHTRSMDVRLGQFLCERELYELHREIEELALAEQLLREESTSR